MQKKMVAMATAGQVSLCALLDVNYRSQPIFRRYSQFCDLLQLCVLFIMSSIFEQKLKYLWNKRRYSKIENTILHHFERSLK